LVLSRRKLELAGNNCLIRIFMIRIVLHTHTHTHTHTYIYINIYIIKAIT